MKRKRWLVEEFDILRNPKHDLSNPRVQEELLDKIKGNCYAAVLASPPCDTFSRVKFANRLGPPPMRCALNPRGFSWLTGAMQKRVRIGNCLADFTFKAALEQSKNDPGMVVVEFPEDLGMVKKGPFAGMRLASIWQWKDFHELLQLESFWTAGIRQCDFGTSYVKPTRLLFNNVMTEDTRLFRGPPVFDDTRTYIGPVPPAKGRVTLAKTQANETFRTSGTAAWPGPLCKLLATMLDDQFQLPSTGDAMEKKVPVPVDEAFEETQRGVKQAQDFWIGGRGEPRFTITLGKIKPFHDGAGLTSPGRWCKERRCFPEDELTLGLRRSLENGLLEKLGETGFNRAFFEIATRQEVFTPALLEWGRNCICEALNGLVSEPLQLTHGQPFFLNLLEGLAKQMKDADWEIIQLYKTGVPVGILTPMPRKPEIFEEKTKWKLSLDPMFPPELENPNYASLKDHEETIEQQFREEEKAGMMLELSDEAFYSRFGDNVAVSALAALQEKDKVRVLLDASHVTQVNHRIQCRDQISTPGPREKHTLMRECRENGVFPIALLADVSKAHRRYLHDPKETGFLGCRIKEGSVWINLVGTFGVACTAYWWSRLAGIIVRVVYGLLGKENPLELLIYVDDLEFLAVNRQERRAVVLAIFYMKLLGMPFKEAKFRGGYEVEWIGLFCNYKTFSMGLSPTRARWMVSWINNALEQGSLELHELERGIGRINFAVNALVYDKPLLGILYMWLAAVRNSWSQRLTIPWAVRLALVWMKKRILEGSALQRVPDAKTNAGEWFRSDAKAEDGKAFVGGWECANGTRPAEARWFAVEIKKEWAPWAFAKMNDPKRTIASLELLGTLLCLKIFGREAMKGHLGTIGMTGSTDNQGNSYAAQKLLSTKWPLTVVLLELVEEMRSLDVELYLQWIPRDENSEADALTNGDYSAFAAEKRIQVDLEKIRWWVLPEMMATSQQLYEDIQKGKEKSKKVRLVSFVQRLKRMKKKKEADPW